MKDGKPRRLVPLEAAGQELGDRVSALAWIAIVIGVPLIVAWVIWGPDLPRWLRDLGFGDGGFGGGGGGDGGGGC